ncbi:unnamed protein product [Adineta steineri]|uniref:Uncharacterized protein n=1 Tax=Adineta steineri TaxID=433720 RepID=A0A819JDF9_9BILA|nr:unnamed protein product [Adineta steineri]CAF3931003.1 unnamed protein product [Adineta steineri]
MSTNANDELILSEPWLIQFDADGNQELNSAINNVTQQTAQLAINQSNRSTQPNNSCSWSEHERLTGEIINQAAKRASAETYKNICVYHPTQNHKPSQDGSNIRPDFVIAWSCDGVRKNTTVVDAKDYHGQVPRREYDKICRDMSQTKATRGILVLGEHATLSPTLRADIGRDNKVDIVQMKNNRDEVVGHVTQLIGQTIDSNFVPDDNKWKTYEPHVSTSVNTKERRLNRHGENPHYTCDSTYHRFVHPRKQDGTIDERYEANQDRNKDGGPDMRVAHNKTQQAQEQHLNEDGTEDMRNQEHREQLVDTTGHHLNADGSLDMRFNENKAEMSPNSSTGVINEQTTENSDMRLKENRENQVDTEGHHLNIDGSPDARCKENQEEVDSSTAEESQLHANQTALSEGINETNTEIPTNNDGTPDMRYTASKEAVASGAIEPSDNLAETSGPVLAGENESTFESTSGDIPTKADGTADMRFSASQDAVASETISRDEVLTDNGASAAGENIGSSSGIMGSMGGDGGSAGPMKADGTPDMRFSANQ